MFVKTQEKEEESVILAQYTIRSKQEYIFRSNRLLDIVGGTEMIRDAFDWVFAAAEQEASHASLRMCCSSCRRCRMPLLPGRLAWRSCSGAAAT